MVSVETRRKTLGRLPWAVFSALGFLGLYGLSNWTPFGQRAENSLIDGYADDALIFELYDSVPFPPLRFTIGTVVLGVGAAVLIAAWRRRWRDAATVAVAGPLAVLATQVFEHVGVRPDLVGAPQNLTAPSYPSGHFAVAATVTLSLLIVVPRQWLVWCAPVLLTWTAVVGGAIQAMFWHRPSDVLGGALLVATAFLFVGAIVSKKREAAEPGPFPWWFVPIGVAFAVASAWRFPFAWTAPAFVAASAVAVALVAYVGLRHGRRE